jgi:arylsulfatase A-like enzyme
MKWILPMFPCLAACLAAAEPRASDGGPPNIVLILADDLGWMDTAFNGSSVYQTPHLDALARDGMVFTSAYAGAANCQPSRACLLSGQYTPRHGVYAVGRTDRGPKSLQRLLPVPNRDGLAPEVRTIAEALKDAGYTTGIFGKWHLDGRDGSAPDQQGFDEAFQARHEWTKNDPEDPKGVFSLTRAACRFLERNQQRPCFIYLSHYAVHGAHQARPMTLEAARTGNHGKTNPLYAACIRDMDESIGQLMQKITELQLERKTLVVFTSDNGATPVSPQEPLRGNKGCYYDGGIRVPVIVRWPGVAKAGARCDVPVTQLDLYPTFLAAAGVKLRGDMPLDGVNLVPLFSGRGNLARESIHWHFPGYLDTPVTRGRDPVFRTRPISVIRKGDWKLHLFHEEWLLDGGRDKLDTNRAVELYNLSNDIGERHDLAMENPAKRDELLGDLLQWLRAVAAPMPSVPPSSPDKNR